MGNHVDTIIQTVTSTVITEIILREHFFFRKTINRNSSTNIYVDFCLFDLIQYCFYFQIIGTIHNLFHWIYNPRFLYQIYYIITIKSVFKTIYIITIVVSLLPFSCQCIFWSKTWKISNNNYRIHSPYGVIKKHHSRHTIEFIVANAGSSHIYIFWYYQPHIAWQMTINRLQIWS